MKVLSFGEIIWDVYPDKKCIGGAPLNFSAHVAKQGVQSFLLSCVGKDDLGKQAKEYLAKFGVKSDFVFECDKQTGVCKVDLDQNGVPSYTIVDNVAYDYIPFEQNVTKEKFDLFCFGSLALRGENNKAVLQKLLEQGNFAKIYCDLNLRAPFFDNATIDFCFKNSHIAKVSDNEFEFVSQQVLNERYVNIQQFAKSLSQAYKNLEIVLLTCGDKGAYAYMPAKDEMFFEPAKKVQVVSTVGAGDSFGAVFVAQYLSGTDLQVCLKMASEYSAYVVSKQDAIPN
ncbi:MAG: carbohydrate kinase [Clostridia bacterium]|nr:carbohydrate kinase [Clostridia bacterium]